MHGGHSETRGHKGCQRHVQDFMETGRIQHGCDWVNIGNLAIHGLEARGRVHPGIGRHHENTRKDATDGDDDSRKPVQKGREAVPAIEIHANKNGLGEKREPFQGEGHADNRPGFFHKAWPQQAKFKRQHGAGHRAHREENRSAARPAFAEIEINRVAGAEIHAFRKGHQQRHPDAKRREDNVESQRHGHLRTGKEEITHSPTFNPIA